MPETNDRLAAIFAQMAQVMQILGADRFRMVAFQRAGRVLEDLPEDVADIGPDVTALARIEGIGKGTAQRIAAYLETGRLEEHEKLLAKLPAGLMPLLDISGLGPKTIALLWKEAGVESLDDLKTKLEGDDLGALPGLGAKKLEGLRRSIAFAESTGGRVLLGRALPLARSLVEALSAMKGVKQATYAGSLRRGRETVGDLDLIVAADAEDAVGIGDAFVELEPVTQILVKGPTKTSVRTADGVQADLRVVAPSQYGAALLYFTGSKEHNVAMRQRAIDRGMRLNEYGLMADGASVAGATEREVFEGLGLPWIAPELREDRGELAAAEEGRLPDLVRLEDIRAELHAHTTASDGHWSIRELALAAAARGCHTVAVTDHSKSSVPAHGLDEGRLEKHIEAIHAVRDELADTIEVLAGSEVDILADGSLDYPRSLLERLDIVVASPHAALSQEPAKATARLLRAIEHPCVTILGHPTGRIIDRRQGLTPDIVKLVDAAASRGIALEINANHHRLDLRDTHARLAVEAGVKLAVNTDAHGPGDFDELVYGVLIARRAGAKASDVVNCQLRQLLKDWVSNTKQ